MTDLTLIFLAGLTLSNLALWWFHDRPAQLGAGPGLAAAAVPVLLVASTLYSLRPHSTGTVFFTVMAMVTSAGGLGSGAVRWSAPVEGMDARLRKWLPVLTANLSVLIYTLLASGHTWRETALTCIAASLVLPMLAALLRALQERQQGADTPELLQGTPLALITAAIVSVAAMGAAGSLPW